MNFILKTQTRFIQSKPECELELELNQPSKDNNGNQSFDHSLQTPTGLTSLTRSQDD